VSYQLLAHWLRERAGLELDAFTADPLKERTRA
jgi:hypothetical protein